MLDIDSIDLEELVEALRNQGDHDFGWMLDRRTGELTFWSRDAGDDPDAMDGPDIVWIEPIGSSDWYDDMADFAARVSDPRVRQRLERALDGRRPFRAFGDAVYAADSATLTAWNVFRDARARRHAVDWLWERRLVSGDAARAWAAAHPDLDVA